MPTKSKSQTTTKGNTGRRLPRKRPPTHPGEMLFEEFVVPLEITQAELARRLGVSYPRLNEIVKMGLKAKVFELMSDPVIHCSLDSGIWKKAISGSAYHSEWVHRELAHTVIQERSQGSPAQSR